MSGRPKLWAVRRRYPHPEPCPMPAAIREMSTDQRPRERLHAHRAEALATRELLAVVLGSGSSGRSALDLAVLLLERYGGSLRRMGRAEPSDLRAVRGVGSARAASVAAALELGRRAAAEPARAERRIRAPRDVHRRLGPMLRDRTQEEFWALYLDTQRHSAVVALIP